MSRADLQNLFNLRLTSEKIGNNCAKQLFKIRLPKLASLGFENTDMTSDVGKTFNKLPVGLRNFRFAGHRNVSSDMIGK